MALGAGHAGWLHFLLHTGSRERKEEVGQGYKTSKPTLHDSLSPASLHLLKVLCPPQTGPLLTDSVFKNT